MKDARPDLILSGVNRGANLAEDVTYSGTVAAAMEGAISGIRSIALSQVYAREGMGDTVPFAAAQAWGARAIEPDAVKGIRVVRQGFHDVDRTKIIEGTDPRGYRYYWFSLGSSDAVPEGSDLAAIAQDYVTVTPLHYDLTQDSAMAATAAAFGQ